MIYTLISTHRRARIHRERMRARYEAGVAHIDQVDATYRDRALLTSRSAMASIAFAAVAVLLLILAVV
ncbi:hypothetical protein [Streptomyces sioyaensis]|uniref:hypothetical protein n=1 Tax=Streptomyces sioyaensis TaxID=67364 RepID=UPI0037106260